MADCDEQRCANGLNDPFGRNARRDEQHYRSVRDTLRASGVTDRAGALECLAATSRSARNFAGIVLGSCLLAYLLLPGFGGVVITAGLVGLLWVGVTAFRSRRYIGRFIAEEFGPEGDANQAPPSKPD